MSLIDSFRKHEKKINEHEIRLIEFAMVMRNTQFENTYRRRYSDQSPFRENGTKKRKTAWMERNGMKERRRTRWEMRRNINQNRRNYTKKKGKARQSKANCWKKKRKEDNK